MSHQRPIPRSPNAANLAAQTARAARDREEGDQIAYDRYRRQTADQVFARLPSTEQEKIEALTRTKQSHASKGPLAETLFKVAKASIVADRHPEKIASLEQWQTQADLH